MFVTSIAGARRARFACAVGFACILAFYLVTSGRVLIATIGPHGWHVGFEDGCVAIGRSQPGSMPYARDVIGTKQSGIAVHLSSSYPGGFAAAWRPFHAKGFYGDRLLTPVWPLLLGLLGGAAYCHGVIVGGRRASFGACAKCGYDLAALRKRTPEMSVTCPECGHATAPIAPAPGVVTSSAAS